MNDEINSLYVSRQELLADIEAEESNDPRSGLGYLMRDRNIEINKHRLRQVELRISMLINLDRLMILK